MSVKILNFIFNLFEIFLLFTDGVDKELILLVIALQLLVNYFLDVPFLKSLEKCEMKIRKKIELAIVVFILLCFILIKVF